MLFRSDKAFFVQSVDVLKRIPISRFIDRGVYLFAVHKIAGVCFVVCADIRVEVAVDERVDEKAFDLIVPSDD